MWYPLPGIGINFGTGSSFISIGVGLLIGEFVFIERVRDFLIIIWLVLFSVLFLIRTLLLILRGNNQRGQVFSIVASVLAIGGGLYFGLMTSPKIVLAGMGHLALYRVGNQHTVIGDHFDPIDKIPETKVSGLNTPDPKYFHHAFLLDHYQKGEYQLAYAEAEQFYMPDYYWDPLDKAIILCALDRIPEAQQKLKEFRRLTPIFDADPDKFLSAIVLYDEIRKDMLKQLSKVGVVTKNQC